MAVILAVIVSFGCDPASGSGERPHSSDSYLYLTGPKEGWTEGQSINIDGKTYPLSIVDAGMARACIDTDREKMFVAYPPESEYDPSTHSYVLNLSPEQRYGSSEGTFIASSCSYRGGEFPFRTAILNGIAGYVSIDLYTTGSAIPAWASLSPCDEERPCAGKIRQDSDSGYWSVLDGVRSVRLSLPRKEMATMEKEADRYTFAVLPATYNGGFEITLEGGRRLKVTSDISVRSGQTEHLGVFHIEPDRGIVHLNVSKNVPLGVPSWGEGTLLSVNGLVAEASSTAGGSLLVPFSASRTFSAVYPPADGYPAEGRYPMHIDTLQPYSKNAASSDPVLCGWSTGEDLVLNQVSGAVCIRMSTVPGVNRLLKEVRLKGEGVAATFTIDPSTGEFARTGSLPEGIRVSFGTNHLQESTDSSNPSSFSFVMLPGEYRGLELEVTSRDGFCKIPEGLGEDDMWYVTTYKVPDFSVSRGASTTLTLAPQVVEYDWIRQNGVCYTGTKELKDCTAAFIDTGWLVPQGSGHSVSYLCTMSGALPPNVSDLRQERVLFGSQGSGSEKPVFFVFNENSSSRRWYATMANLAGRETYKQETVSQKYSMAADLDGIRSIIIGTDGIKKTSYIYMRMRRDDLGSTTWTDLHPKTDYFKFTGGSLKNEFPVYLFCKNYSGNIGSPCPHIKIHRFTVTYDGVVQRDLTPCTVDGIPGMTDLAHPGTYYFNANPYTEIVFKNGCLTALEVGLNSDIK